MAAYKPEASGDIGFSELTDLENAYCSGKTVRISLMSTSEVIRISGSVAATLHMQHPVLFADVGISSIEKIDPENGGLHVGISFLTCQKWRYPGGVLILLSLLIPSQTPPLC